MNFTYLSQFPQLKKLYNYCTEAEEFALAKPGISASSARKAMEFMVKMIYASLVGDSYGLTTFEMITDVRFTGYVADPVLINSFHYIRKMGNVAVHEGELSPEEALRVLEELHFLTGEFCILLGLVEDYPEFEAPTAAVPKQEPPKAEKKVEVSQELVAQFAPRMRSAKFQVHHGRNKEENKQLYLKASLREAGWPMVSRPNQPMPGAAGLNIILDTEDTVDYVLYGRDNRPLAIIEYTVTSQNLVAGRAKAIEKANKMAVKYGYKPIVYYTNGYHIYIIDQLGYKPRRVFQFHSLEELELLKLRAGTRQDISAPQIDESIAGRTYQKEAITAACDAFMQNRRHALLVMATGTGKTRVSIALADVLMKAGWVKNILFLADRTSLVRQAHKNFTKLLPSVTTSVYSGGSMNRDANARIIFSTYQTMINLVNDDTREFGIGRFDLIIIDEAHRSIFRKYSALFHYFDSLMVGLTATPRVEDNKSTYQMFELPNGQPDYAYELEEAIADGYLVGFTVLDKTTEAMRRGIRYDELSEEEKQSIEDAFLGGSSENAPELDGTVLNSDKMKSRYVINLGTIDAMLNDLMKNGLKVNGGDQLGKTIIFARSHLEAEKIVERFFTLYPHLGLEFCKLIDSQVSDNLSLIDNFGQRDQQPQIAVSVDMMDTGIDVPDVLNLVFFKSSASKIKFLQMIGRGTRLSPDVFGPGLDKEGFLIFDYYDNFNYFNMRNTWSTIDENSNGKIFKVTPQTVLINQKKLNILRNLIESEELSAFDTNYRDKLKNHFISSVQNLCNDDIEVQYHMAYVSKYRTAEMWNGFTNAKIDEICEKILPLLPPDPDPVKVKTFDLLIYAIEENVPKRMEEGKDIRKIRHGYGNVGTKITKMMESLLQLKTIPAIAEKRELISQMKEADILFDHFLLENCERVRKELRQLIPYIPDDVSYYVINAQDFVIDPASGGSEVAKPKTYEEKAQDFMQSGDPLLAKIRNLDVLTPEEKETLEDKFKTQLGTEGEYASWTGGKALLPHLRVQLGIADEALQTKFGAFLNNTELNSQQLAYMNQIIGYVRENGDIGFLDLQRISPFCDIDIIALFGSKITHIKTLINGLHKSVL